MNQVAGQWHWHELNSSDINSAADFYSRTFGWNVRSMEFDGQPYRMLFSGGAPHAGIAPVNGDVQPQWSVFLSVDNCDAARDSVLANGGSVHFGPVSIPGVGRIAGCSDPQGAAFSLIEPAEES